jgi:putative hydrolase of the HAD superfamily
MSRHYEADTTSPTTVTSMQPDAVIFDWGGTLTRWHDIDFHAESLALAHAVIESDHPVDVHADALHRANQVVWGRSRDHQQSATVADLFTEAGLAHDADLLTHYREFWEPHTSTDPQVEPLFRTLRDRGIKVGVLSNTIWPRQWHEDFFARDGVLDLIDGAVYSSEIPWTKPHPEAFRAALAAVGVEDPARAVFVGDRPFDDIHGAKQVGMRAVLVPHSAIPDSQKGHVEGDPDAVVQRLGDLLAVVDGWNG